MTTWKPPHQTARQKYAAQDPTVRKLNKSAQLAPSVPVPANRCGRDGCADVRLIHRDDGQCLRAGCECKAFVAAVADA